MTAAEILNVHELRKTPTRLTIVQQLLESNTPLAESDIQSRMGGSYDRVTFYRTIQTLLESGIIHRIVADNTTIRYALNGCSEHHHEHTSDHVHFYCLECEKVECLKSIAVNTYPLPEGYSKETCDVVIKGICKQCANK